MDDTREGAAQASARRKQARRRRQRNRRVIILLTLLVLAGVLGYFCLGMFFRLKEFYIEGNVRYTTDDVIAGTGLELDSGLFSVDGKAVAARLKTALPYIEEADVSLRFPTGVAVTVSETSPVARIAYGGKQYLLSGKMKVLEAVPAAAPGADDPYAGLPLIVYPGVESCDIAGSPVYDNNQIEEIVIDIIGRLVDNNILGDVSEIDLSDPYHIRLQYLGRFEVVLGEYTEFEYKFRYFLAVAAERAEHDVGTINVSDTQRGFYRPRQE